MVEIGALPSIDRECYFCILDYHAKTNSMQNLESELKINDQRTFFKINQTDIFYYYQVINFDIKVILTIIFEENLTLNFNNATCY